MRAVLKRIQSWRLVDVLFKVKRGWGGCLSHGYCCLIVYWLDAEITQDASKRYVVREEAHCVMWYPAPGVTR